MNTWKCTFAGMLIASASLLAVGASAQTVNPIEPVIPVEPLVPIDPIVVFELYDSKTLAGNACGPMIGSQSGLLNHYPAFLRNVSQTYTRIICPIVRDNTVNTTGTARVYVYGYNPGGSFSCALYSYSSHGVWQQSNSAGTGAVGNFTLSLDVNLSTNSGFYTMSCAMPRNSRLYSYKWIEFLRTDKNS